MRLRSCGDPFTAAGDAVGVGIPDRTRLGAARLGFRLIVQGVILVITAQYE
jgi:hypothetical protein